MTDDDLANVRPGMQFRKTVTLTILYYDTGEDKWMARDTDENYVLLDEEALSDWEVLSDA